MGKVEVDNPRAKTRLASLQGEGGGLNVTHVSDVANILSDLTSDLSKTVGAFSTIAMLIAVVADFVRAFNKRIHTSAAYTVVKLSAQFALGMLAVLSILGIFLLPVILLPVQMAGNSVALLRRSVALGRSSLGANSDEALLRQKLEKLETLLSSGESEKNLDARLKKEELILDCYVLTETVLAGNALSEASRRDFGEVLTRLKKQDASLELLNKNDQQTLLKALHKHQLRKRNWVAFQVTMQLFTLLGCGLMVAFPYAGAAIVLLSALVALLAVFVHHRKAIAFVFTEVFSTVAADFNRGMKSMVHSFMQLARGRSHAASKVEGAVPKAASDGKRARLTGVAVSPPPPSQPPSRPATTGLSSVQQADAGLRPGTAPPAPVSPRSSSPPPSESFKNQ